MLSRVGERIYWLARYLERVENTARLVNVHTALLLDLPEHHEINWFNLVTIYDAETFYHQKHLTINESGIMYMMLADTEFSSSLISSLVAARENARTSLDILPEETWEQVNELYLLVKSELSSIGNRSRRQKLLLNIMERCQSIWGIIANHMSRNYAYNFIQIGKHIERADMTSRILEMTSLLVSEERSHSVREFESLLWANLLRALSARQMFTQAEGSALSANKVLMFLISDTTFPRSLKFSLRSIGDYLKYLPNPTAILQSQTAIYDLLTHYQPDNTAAAEIPAMMDNLQLNLAGLNHEIAHAWFYPEISTS